MSLIQSILRSRAVYFTLGLAMLGLSCWSLLEKCSIGFFTLLPFSAFFLLAAYYMPSRKPLTQ